MSVAFIKGSGVLASSSNLTGTPYNSSSFTPASTNNVLVILVRGLMTDGENPALSSITFGGVDISSNLVAGATTTTRVRAINYSFVVPVTSTSAQAVAVAFVGQCRGVEITIMEFSGVDSASPIVSAFSGDGVGSSTGIDFLSLSPGNMIIGSLVTRGGTNAPFTVGNGATIVSNRATGTSGSSDSSAVAFYRPMVALDAVYFDISWPSSADYGYGGLELRAGSTSVSTNDQRSATTSGRDTSNAIRSVRLRGESTSNNQRNALLTGKEASNSQRSATLLAFDKTENERSANIRGGESSNGERGASLAGYEQAQSDRGAVAVGKESTANDRNALLRGSETAQGDRSATITGIASGDSNRYATLFGGVVSPQYAVSDVLTASNSRRIDQVILHPEDVITPGDSYVEYEVTVNGTDWEQIEPDTLYTVTGSGNDLQWRIILHASSDGRLTPSVGFLSAVWTVIPSDPAQDERGATLYGYIEHEIVLNDTIVANDTQSRALARPVSLDSVNTSDTTNRAAVKTQADTVSAIDAVVKALRYPKEDVVQETDIITKLVSPLKQDVVNASDTTQRDQHKGIADSVALLDAASKKVAHQRADTVLASDNASKRSQVTAQDAISTADAILKRVTTLIQTIVQPDDLSPKSITIPFTELLVAVDLVSVRLARTFYDSVTAVEASRRLPGKRFDETQPVVDVHTKQQVLNRYESVTTTDASFMRIFLARAEEVAISDASVRAFGTRIYETITAEDANTLLMGKRPADQVAVTDALAMTIALNAVADIVEAIDGTGMTVQIALQDEAIVEDVFNKNLAFFFADYVTLTEAEKVVLRKFVERWLYSNEAWEFIGRSDEWLAQRTRNSDSEDDTIKARSIR